MKQKLLQKRTQPLIIESDIKNILLGKYYNLYQNSFKWYGITSEQRDYILRRFWSEGTCAAFNIKNVGVGFAPYTSLSWNMYDFPETVQLINKRNLPFIPLEPQRVMHSEDDLAADTVLGWYQRNHKPVRMIVDYYINRIAQVEMVINTNLQLQKLPWFVAIDAADRSKMEDIISQILNNEIVVFTDMEDLAKLKSIVTSTPYIIDKLNTYKNTLEADLLTYLGVDNTGSYEKKERMVEDEVDANNEAIDISATSFEDCLKEWITYINKLFNTDIRIESTHQSLNQHNISEDTKTKKDPILNTQKEEVKE